MYVKKDTFNQVSIFIHRNSIIITVQIFQSSILIMKNLLYYCINFYI